MAAATEARNTPYRNGVDLAPPVAAATLVWAGTLAALDALGNVVPASDTDGLIVAGRAEKTADNSAGAAGDIRCNIMRGVFLWDNSETEALTAANIGDWAYVEDDQTVAVTSTHKVKAGRIVDVVDDGVWVDCRPALGGATLADDITGAADLAALKTALVNVLQPAALIK